MRCFLALFQPASLSKQAASIARCDLQLMPARSRECRRALAAIRLAAGLAIAGQICSGENVWHVLIGSIRG
ncbi:hypothetical protein OKW42_001520 [Paraburkholderia sp. WC7.3d]